MKIFGSFKQFSNIRIGVRNLLVNFFATNDSDSSIDLQIENGTLLTKNTNGDTYYCLDKNLQTTNVIKVDNNTNFNILTVVFHNDVYYVCGNHTFNSSNYPNILAYDDNFNLLWGSRLNGARRDVFNDIFFGTDFLGITLRTTRSNSENLFELNHLDYNTGNVVFRKIMRYKSGFDNPNFNFYRISMGNSIATIDNSYSPYISWSRLGANNARIGSAQLGIYDNSSKKTIIFNIYDRDNFYINLVSVYNIRRDQHGEYYGGCFSQTRASSRGANVRNITFFTLKINSDNTYSLYSNLWWFFEGSSTSTQNRYTGFKCSINESGDMLGIVRITAPDDSPYVDNQYDLLYIMPFGPHSSSNVSDSWIIEPPTTNERIGINDVVYTSGNVYLSLSNGTIVLNIEEIRNKDSVDLGGGYTLQKTSNSSFYNYIINNDNALTFIYRTLSERVNVTNIPLNATDDFDNVIHAVSSLSDPTDVSGYTTQNVEFNTSDVILSRPTSEPLNINRNNLSDR